MTTNKRPGTCEECGGLVMTGNGILTQEWSNQDDDMGWVVRHADKSICSVVKSNQIKEQSMKNAISQGINYIKSHGTRLSNVMDGDQVIHDGRKGYNQVGYLLTRTGNTLYLTSRNNLDGYDMSETYSYDGNQTKIEDLLWTMELI
jgi:hypothetical protein